MSKVSQPQEEQLTQHPLDAVVEELESLLEKLRMELDVAPTDRTAHQDLLRRIIQASESGLQVRAQTYPKSSNLPQPQAQELTEEELELLNSLEGISEGKIGEDIDVDAMNKRLKERGYQIQLSFPETPED
jgi:sugar-specific transcriptional regulator TrmB